MRGASLEDVLHADESNGSAVSAGRSEWHKGPSDIKADACSTSRRRLAHPEDGLVNLRGLSTLRWAELHQLIGTRASSAPRADEHAYTERVVDWLRSKSIGTESE